MGDIAVELLLQPQLLGEEFGVGFAGFISGFEEGFALLSIEVRITGGDAQALLAASELAPGLLGGFGEVVEDGLVVEAVFPMDLRRHGFHPSRSPDPSISNTADIRAVNR